MINRFSSKGFLWLALSSAFFVSGCNPSSSSSDTPGTEPAQKSNRAPVANSDQITTIAGVSTAVMVLSNDNDPDGDSLKLMSVSTSSSGTAVIDDAGTTAGADDFIVFTSAPDYSGTTTLSYVIEDTFGESAQADIDITVNRREKSAGNAAPVANADVVNIGTTNTIAVLSNDSDPDGSTLAITSWTQAANAIITLDDAGTPGITSDDTLVITPVAGFTGQDSFVYTITDGTDNASAEVVFSVGAPQPANRSGRVPLAGAVVTLYAADANGLPTGRALLQTVSDSAGVWRGQLNGSNGSLIIQASGGFFLDDVRGLAKTADSLGSQFDSDDILETALPAGQAFASMTLASNALLLHARREAPATGFEQALTNSRNAFSAALGFDPVTQQLAQPLLPTRNANRADHLMLLGGLANALNASSVALLQNSVNPEIVQAVIRDFSDCALDGIENDTQVQVELGGIQVALPVTDRIDIAGLRFRNNVAELFGNGGSLNVDSAQCAQSPVVAAPIFTNVPPTLTIAADTGAGTDASLALIANALTAALAVDGSSLVTITNNAPAVFPLGLTTVTFTATSATGSQATARFDVIVSDQTPPVITAPANISVPEDIGALLTTVVIGSPVVSDNVSATGALSVSNNAPSAGFPLGTTQITWTVVDEAGLSASALQLVTISANGSPLVTGLLPPIVAVEGIALSSDLSVVFSDPENDPLTYSITGLPVGSGYSFDGLSGQLTGTANNVDSASSPLALTVVASDGVLSATANVLLTVTAVNDPPVVVSSLSTVTLTEDVSATIATAQVFSDADSPVLTYSATGLPSPLTINASSGVISGIPGDVAVAGSPYTVNIAVSDGDSNASTGFVLNVLNVNDAPTVLNPLGTQSINQGQSFTLSLASVFTDIDSAGITIGATGLPASFTLSGFNLAGTPTNADALIGNFGIVLLATDTEGATASESFLLVVNNINDSPTLVSPIGNQSATEDLAFSLDVSGSFTDIDMDSLSHSATGLPPTLAIAANGLISGTPNNADAASSPFTITVTASDSGGLFVTDNFVLTIVNTNDAPTISAIANPSPVNEDSVIGPVAFSVGDAETSPGSLVVTATSTNPVLFPTPNIVVGGNGPNRTVTLTPAANVSGSATIDVQVNDGSATSVSSFDVVVNAVNDAPSFAAVADIVASEDFATALTVVPAPDSVPNDEMSQVVNYSLAPATASFVQINLDATTGQITFTATPDANGTQTFVLTADDGQSVNNLFSRTFDFTVTAVNDDPIVVSPTGNQSATEDIAYSLDVSGSFSDIDMDTLSHSATGLPPTLSISSNGLISGTPNNADAAASPFTVTVSATDPNGGSVTDSFNLTVVNTNDAPTISVIPDPSPVNEDIAIGPIAFIVNDDESSSGSLVVTATSSNPALFPTINMALGGSGANRTITLTPAANANGTATITVQVSDGTDTNSSSFDVVVTAVNDAPSFAAIADITADEDFAAPVIVDPMPDSVPTDEQSQVVTYSLSPATASFVQVNFNPATGRTTFTASPDDSGTQTFVLTADDGQALDNQFSRAFEFTVNALQDPPEPQDDSYTSVQDSAETHFVLGNDSDDDGDVLQLVSAGPTTTAGGTVSVNDAGTAGDFTDDFVDYVPAPGYFGMDSYTYTISDGSQSDTANVSVTVLSLDMDGDGLSNDEEAALAISTHLCLSPSDPDSDNDGLSDGLEVQVGSNPCIDTGTQMLVRIDPAGTSTEWPDAVASIPATLTSGTAGAPTVVLVASGVYSQSFDYNNVCDNVVFIGSLDATDTTLTPVLDADGAPTTVVDLSGGDNADLRDCDTIELKNMRFREGLGNVFGGGKEGGALHVGGTSTVELDGVWLTDSSVDAQGGGIAVSNFSVVTMRNSQIQNNVVTAGKGGGGAWVGSNATLILEDSIVINNRADGNGGGGLYFDPNSTGIVTGSVISGNEASANYGGGVFSSGFASSLSIDSSIINGNRAGLNGGGIFVYQTTAQINNVLVSGNYAANSGGGMYIEWSDTTVNNATVVYNQVGFRGAGIFADLDIPVIRDSIVYANRIEDRVLADVVKNYDTYSDLISLDSDFNLVENQNDGGSDINLSSVGARPEFTSGFYLNQALSFAIDSGSRNAAGSGIDGLSTRTDGTADSGVIDRGYHYSAAPKGTAASIERIYPAGNFSLTSGDPAEFVFRLITVSGDTLTSGHEVSGVITSAPASFSWNTATVLDPLGSDSTFADDLGNGVYRLPMDLSLVAPLPVVFDVVVDGTLVDSVTVTLDP